MSLHLVTKQIVEILGLVVSIIILIIIMARILAPKKWKPDNTSIGTGNGTDTQLSEGNSAVVTIGSNLELGLDSIV
uniref:Uncharacterized protein n=1 Tax=Fagus sylvatica TaxID=28930 RepID=A0A2N9G8G0_FAGSY